jgi:hypothetical protein
MTWTVQRLKERENCVDTANWPTAASEEAFREARGSHVANEYSGKEWKSFTNPGPEAAETASFGGPRLGLQVAGVIGNSYRNTLEKLQDVGVG